MEYQDKIKKLLDVVDAREKGELSLLHNAVVQTINAYKSDPTSLNKKNWDSAADGLDKIVDKLWSKYFPGESKDLVLKNIPAVVQYLFDAGWKISTSSAYKHRKSGKISPRRDGSYYISDVEKYAKRWLEPKSGPGMSIEVLQRERAEADLQKTRAQAQHWETKTRLELGELVSREEWDRELASRARIFRSDIENFIRSEAGELIRMVEGNADKTPVMIDYYLRAVELWLNRYSQPRDWGKKTHE
jgi:Asp-tRNA(Asn)/Glu-tRNA(Gln) amidotransferase A subunit family amidase